MKRLLTTLIIITFISSGCATVRGPEVSKEEIQELKQSAEVKALDFKLKQLRRVNRVGYHIVRHISVDNTEIEPSPFLGLFCMDVTDATKRYFDSEPEQGVYVAFVLDQTPAAEAQLQAGDVVTHFNQHAVKKISKLNKFIKKIEAEDPVRLKVVRGEDVLDVDLKPEMMSVDVGFGVIHSQTVNSIAYRNYIATTYGLLDFAQDEDSLAAVLAHELAHITAGHIKRKVGGEVLRRTITLGMAIPAGLYAPGAGAAVLYGVGGISKMFGAKFSRNLEREADYYSIQFMLESGYDPQSAIDFHERLTVEVPKTLNANFLSSHPNSPERMIRMQKIMDEMTNQTSK